MRFVIPYTVRDPLVAEMAPANVEWRDVSEDDHAYWRLLSEMWADGESFAVIEHDVLCRPDVIEQFESCECPWAVFGYSSMCHPECQEAWRNMLGCTRFRSDLIAACPDALTSIPPERRVWNNLCDEIAGDKIGGIDQPTLRPGSLRAAQFTHHWHLPLVRHISWEGHPR